MALGSAICVVGAILQTAGQNLSMLMGGRFILGVGAVLVQTAGPAYVVEMSYPKYRAQLTGGYQACFFLGTIISTWLEYGLNRIDTTLSYPWRLPLAIQGLPSVIMLCAIWFIPESPRWYKSINFSASISFLSHKYHVLTEQALRPRTRGRGKGNPCQVPRRRRPELVGGQP